MWKNKAFRLRSCNLFEGVRAGIVDPLEDNVAEMLTGMSRDERRVIVRTFSDKSLGACYLYEPSIGRLEKLAELSPWLNEAEMADVQPIRFTSRDGLTLHGYLTLPKSVPPVNLPIVVNPHGGPWARDVWGFSPQTQFHATWSAGQQ